MTCDVEVREALFELLEERARAERREALLARVRGR